MLVKSKENIDKTKFCFTEIGKRNVYTSLQLSIYTAVLTLQLQINLKTRQPDIQNKRYCFITFCCAQTLPSYYFLKYILKSSPGFFYSDMLSNSVKLFFFNTFSPKLHPVLCQVQLNNFKYFTTKMHGRYRICLIGSECRIYAKLNGILCLSQNESRKLRVSKITLKFFQVEL